MEIGQLKSIINQLDITDIYKLHHPTVAKCTFFSTSHETFNKLRYTVNHKANFSKFRNIEIIQYLLSDNNGIELEIYNVNITRKSPIQT